MRALETRYRGCRFRSRLEARWAVFFDTLGVEWEYEMEGFDLGSLGWYLPDFWLRTVHMWVEVKPGEFSALEAAKCEAVARLTGSSVLMLDGGPAERPFLATECFEYEGPIAIEYVLTEEYLGEGRFFCCPWPGDDCWSAWPLQRKAVEAARAARFDGREEEP